MKLVTLSVAQRFAALVALCGIAIALPAGLYGARAWQATEVATREADGVGPARMLLEAIRKIQQHRGLSAVLLGGNDATAAARAAKRDEVEAAIAAFDRAIKDDRAEASRLGQQWQQTVAKWKALADDIAAKRIDGPNSSARHTEVIALALNSLDEALSHWVLILDPHADAYYMVSGGFQEAPRAIENLGQMRARGANLLAAGGAPSPGERARFEALEASFGAHFDRARGALDKSVAADAATKAAIAAPVGRLETLGRSGIDYARQHVLKPETLTLPSSEYFTTITGTIDGMYESLGQVLDALDGILRTHRATARRNLVAGGVVLGLLFGGALLIALTTGRWIRRELGAEPDELRAASASVASGDLAAPLRLRAGDRHSVMASMEAMRKSLSEVVGTVRQGADSVATASAQIAQGNQDLSSRTEQQASALEQTSASMEELGGTVRQTHDNARLADQLARGASAVAVQGGELVSDVVTTMQGIQEASDRIADIIGTIDGIAFQTNILALNAAVEAARAGEQGRGFAVVAGEVRSLAQRAAQAAREIKTLISASVERVQVGSEQVGKAGSTMQEIVGSVQRVTDIMAEISTAAAEQNSGVAQVGQAVSQMDHATQQNAALVEQSAAAAESLKVQAEQLVQAVAAFKLATG